jgi:hypothetical protein
MTSEHVLDDLLVSAVSVQGGESDIGGAPTDFARIVMSGVGSGMTGIGSGSSIAGAEAPRRQRAAVLELAAAEQLATELQTVVSLMAESLRTPTPTAMGIWSWRSEPLLDDDLMVRDVDVCTTAIRDVSRVTPAIRLKFTGSSLRQLSSSYPSVHVQGAIFAGPRQVQALVSSLKKVVRSSLQRRCVEVYLPERTAL